MKVMVVTGSSGGHIFPALSFLDSLTKGFKKTEALLVLPAKSRQGYGGSVRYRAEYLPIVSVRLSFQVTTIREFMDFFKGSLKSAVLLLRFHPDIVVGFGSLACVPVIIAAWLFRIKTLLHEQNVIPGRANRLLAFFVDKIAVSFKETEKYFEHCRRRVVYTGNPLRQELQRCDKPRALDYFNLPHGIFTILVMGGSQGSHAINSAFVTCVAAMPGRSGFQIIHLAGKNDTEALEAEYKKLGVRVRVLSFLQPMQYAYSAADVVISRAGATAITEIAYFGLPAILVPYPYAYRHQMTNALMLEKRGAAIIIEEQRLDADTLRCNIQLLLNNPARLREMAEASGGICQPRAADLLAEAAVSLL